MGRGGAVERKKQGEEKRVTVEFELPESLAIRLRDFSREHGISESLIVERALEEYFFMGDIAH